MQSDELPRTALGAFHDFDFVASCRLYVQLKLEQGDEFLVLACDGIWDVKTNQQVVDFVKERLQQVSSQSSAPVIDAVSGHRTFCTF